MQICTRSTSPIKIVSYTLVDLGIHLLEPLQRLVRTCRFYTTQLATLKTYDTKTSMYYTFASSYYSFFFFCVLIRIRFEELPKYIFSRQFVKGDPLAIRVYAMGNYHILSRELSACLLFNLKYGRALQMSHITCNI